MASEVQRSGDGRSPRDADRAAWPKPQASPRTALCLNCGAELIGAPYCQACGQKAHVHRIARRDSGTIWCTACSISTASSGGPCRCWRGGRASSPAATSMASGRSSSRRSRMFLFSVFLMFAILSVYGLSLASLSTEGVPVPGLDTARAEVVRQLDEARGRRAAFGRGETVRREDGSAATAADLDREIEEAEERLAAIEGLSTRTGGFRVIDGQPTGWGRLDKGIKQVQRESGPGALQDPDERLQILLAAHPAVGAVRLGALLLDAPLPPLRPHLSSSLIRSPS